MLFSKKVVFQGDFYLARDRQPYTRWKSIEKKADGLFSGFGAEFLFMNIEDLTSLEKQEKQAREIQKKFESKFSETYFSIHAPWLPQDATAFELNKKWIQNTEKLLGFCSDFVDVVNVHVGVVPLLYWQTQLKQNWENKRAQQEKLVEALEQLSDYGSRICLENLFAPLDYPNETSYLSNLASDLASLSRSKKVGVTIDTAHAGITIESCRRMVKNNSLEAGFFEEEWKEIKETAKNGMKTFVDLGNKIWHLHFSDFALPDHKPVSEARDGKVPGKGNTDSKKLFEALRQLAAVSRKPVGITLEIKEENYTALPRFEETLKLIGEEYGFGN